MPPRTPLNSIPHGTSRRDFLTFGTAASLGALGLGLPEGVHAAAHANDASWYAGQLVHLIPAASHDRFLIKASLQVLLARAPWLTVNDRRVVGEQTDAVGRFWRFDVCGLQPAAQYTLCIVDVVGKPLVDA